MKIATKTKMGNLRFHFCFIIFCVTTSIIMPNYCHGKICLPEKHTALFVFGDSAYDVGNNNYINVNSTDSQANFSPYGETFFKYPTGRFSDGRLISDFIAEYAKLPPMQPYLFPGYQRFIDGANFASAGAGAMVDTNQGLVINHRAQLNNFNNVIKALRQELGDEGTKALLGRAVYLISFGGNDYVLRLAENSTFLSEMVIGNLTSVIKEIYEKGGRKFGFVSLVPLGCLPIVKAFANDSSGSCIEEVSALAQRHNTAFSAALQKLEKQLKGFKYSFANFYDLAMKVINSPSKYGFKQVNMACCGSGPYRGYNSCGGQGTLKHYELCENPRDHVFFDYSHATEKANELFAQLLWSGNGNETGPYNLKALFEA